MPHGTVFLRRNAVALCLLLLWLPGCAAFHPMNGVPARYIPDDMKAARRNGQRTIDLSLLNQRWDKIHRVDGGDVLGIYIGGVLGKIDENPVVQLPQNSDYLPAAGVPVTVREDGTISLPMIGALTVRGLTTRETEEAIRKAYTNFAAGKEFLTPGRERILVSLQRPRQTRVLVVRQDSRNEPVTNAAVGLLNLGTSKRGTGKAVSLPAYHNDVLNALIATDGLPGLDAENAVYIIRSNPRVAGNDGLWSPTTDPEELIRQSKKIEEPVIRSQNPNGLDYRSQFSARTNSPYGNPNSDYRSLPAQPYSPTPISPTAIGNPDQQSGTPHPTTMSGAMPQTGVPNSAAPPNWNVPQPAGQPNWNSTPGAVTQPYAAPTLPNQGYSIPDDVTAEADPTGANSPYGDMIQYDPKDFDGADGIGGLEGRRIIRIPIRLGPDEHIDIKEEDIILHDGDIVFIESRDTEVFFTGGLLGGGQYTLPRDIDLNILEALSIATSRVTGAGAARAIGGVSALNSDVTISPSNVVIIRKLPEGGEILIKVNLYEARNDRSERLYIQPGDYIYLQYTPLEAMAAFIERHLLEGALFAVLTRNSRL